jgi:hypothetical protein
LNLWFFFFLSFDARDKFIQKYVLSLAKLTAFKELINLINMPNEQSACVQMNLLTACGNAKMWRRLP